LADLATSQRDSLPGGFLCQRLPVLACPAPPDTRLAGLFSAGLSPWACHVDPPDRAVARFCFRIGPLVSWNRILKAATSLPGVDDPPGKSGHYSALGGLAVSPDGEVGLVEHVGRARHARWPDFRRQG